MMNFIFGMQIDIEVFCKLILSFLGVCNQACPKVPKISLHILQYLQKSMGNKVDFLPADKHKNFLQIDSITLGVHSQACPKYPKQQVYNIFAISQEKHEG